MAHLGQVDLHIAHMRIGPQEVMPHQTVEVERRGGSGIGLHAHHLGQVHRHPRHGLRHPVRHLDRRALGHVDHHGQFLLVVEWQQLHRHMLGIEQAQRAKGQRRRHQQKGQTAPLGRQHRPRHPREEPPQKAAIRAAMPMHRRLARDLDHQPGRHHHRNEERDDHRSRSHRRNGAHIGPHQPRHEQHRQQRRHHRQRGHDGGVAHLGHRIDRAGHAVAAILHPPVARDILDHHDRVIHQNADRKDQREQRHPVQRVAHDPGPEQRQQDRHRDHHRHHDALAPANRHQRQHDDRQCRQEQLQKQRIRLFLGGFAIVPRDLDRNRVGDQRLLQGRRPAQNILGHHHRIRSGALGKGQRHRRAARDPAIRIARHMRHDPVGHVIHKGNIRHIAHINRPPVARGQQKPRNLGGCRQALPRDQPDLLARVAHPPRRHRAIGRLHLARKLLQRHTVKRHPLGVGRDADRLLRLAHDIGQAHILDLGQIGPQLSRQPRQIIGADLRPILGGQGQRDNRHIVNAPPNNQRLRDTHGDAVHIGAHLLMHPQDRRIRIRAHLEPRGDHRAIIHRLRIDVFHVIDRLDDGLHRLGHQPYRVLGTQAGGLQQDVHHRNRDLRLLLARDDHQRDQPHRQSGQHDQRRQRRADEPARQISCDPKTLRRVAHGRTTSSPARSPDRTSRRTSPPASCRWPSITARSP